MSELIDENFHLTVKSGTREQENSNNTVKIITTAIPKNLENRNLKVIFPLNSSENILAERIFENNE